MHKESLYNNLFSFEGSHYIYNSMTKAIIKIPDDIDNLKDFLDCEKQTKHITSASQSELSILVDNGFIVDESVQEAEVMEYLFKKNYFDSSQLYLTLVPTLHCNLTCPYCFEKAHRDMYNDPSYFQSLKQFGNKMFRYYNHIEFSLFGGEPLLFVDEFLDLLQFTKTLANEFRFTYGASLTTNGTLITDKLLDSLIQAQCNQIQITIDGYKGAHDLSRKYKDGRGSYDNLMHIINKTMKNRIVDGSFSFILRINLLNNTIDQFESMLNDISLDLRPFIQLLIRPIYSTETFQCKNDNDLNHLKLFYDKANEFGFPLLKTNHHYRSCECCNDVNTVIICPDLSVWKCINSMSTDSAKIGQLSPSGQMTLDPVKVVNWQTAANCFSDSKCSDCSLLPDCYGGCILAKIRTGQRKCATIESTALRNLYQ